MMVLVRDKAKKERNEVVRNLVSFVRYGMSSDQGPGGCEASGLSFDIFKLDILFQYKVMDSAKKKYWLLKRT